MLKFTESHKDIRKLYGMYYTWDENILKVIKPLFLDDLYKEFDKCTVNNQLVQFHEKLCSLTFFDPSCGSGNFLSKTYRELKYLESKIPINKRSNNTLNLSQLYGIDIETINVQICINRLHNDARDIDSNYKGPNANIKHADALEDNWYNILNVQCDYIIGNPPFVGSSLTSKKQKSQVFNITKSKKLDLAAAWLVQAGKYCTNATKIGFITTSSICQGEQVYPLWSILDQLGLEIQFAYKPFMWDSDAEHKANVSIIILGLSKENINTKYLYDNKTILQTPYITPYLTPSTEKIQPIKFTTHNLNNLPKIYTGLRPDDDGNYIFTVQEYNEFLKKEPNTKKYIKPFLDGKDFLNNNMRYIILPYMIPTKEYDKLPHTLQLVNNVKEFRSKSISKSTRKFANTPKILKNSNSLPTVQYLFIPNINSENRPYLVIDFVDDTIIPASPNFFIKETSLGLFGLLSSKMHLIWIQTFCGRLKNSLRYSNFIYNTFPVPKGNLKSLEPYAQKILDIRSKYKDLTLADLYNNNSIPDDLLNTHQQLDKKVESLYRKEPFIDDGDRLEFLLSEYSKMVGNQTTLI